MTATDCRHGCADRAAIDTLVVPADSLDTSVVHGHRVGTPQRGNFPNAQPLDLAGTGLDGPRPD